MPGALVLAVGFGWGAAILGWAMGASPWLALLLVPGLGVPVLLAAALLAARAPSRPAGKPALQTARA